MASRIYVGNLPTSLTERDLEEEFIRFGTLRSVWVARKPPGFAVFNSSSPSHRSTVCSSPISHFKFSPITSHHNSPQDRLLDTSCQSAISIVLHHFTYLASRDDSHISDSPDTGDIRDAEDAVHRLDGFKGWRVEFSRNRGPKWNDAPRGGPRSPPPYRRRSPTPDRYKRRSPSYDRGGRDYRRRSPSYEPPPRRRSPSYEPRARSRSPVRGRSLSRSPVD